MRKSCWYFFYAYRGIKRSCKSLVNLLRNISNRKLLSSTMRPFGLSWKLRPRFTFSGFFFFSCAWTVKSHDFTVQGTKNTVYALFTGPTILFTHLKIILLQCFQFSVSATISSIQTNPILPKVIPYIIWISSYIYSILLCQCYALY